MFNAEIKKNDAPKCCKRVVGCISQWQQSFSEGPDKKKLCCYKHALSGRNDIPISGWIELIYLKEASRNKEDLGLQLVWKSHMWRPCTGSSVPSPSIISLLGSPCFARHLCHLTPATRWLIMRLGARIPKSLPPLWPLLHCCFLKKDYWHRSGSSSFWPGMNSGVAPPSLFRPPGSVPDRAGRTSPIPSWLYNRECKQLSFIVLCPEPYLPVSCFK